MGGAFVRNIGKHPTFWSRPNCETRYELPNGFYSKPTMLFIEEELPKTVQQRLGKDFESYQSVSGQNPWLNFLKIIVVILGSFVGLAFVSAIGLLPLALVYTPLPWTIPGFVATLLVSCGGG